MKRGTRVVVVINGQEAAARYLNPIGNDFHLVQLFGENQQSSTDKGLREVSNVVESPMELPS